MKTIRIIVGLFLVIALNFFYPHTLYATEVNPYKNIVYFGDSLSDNGNLYYYDWGFLPKSPPYFNGRFTNGHVWTDHVSKYFYEKHFTNSVNYAFGGETVLYHGPMSGYLPYNLSWSVTSYLLRTMLSDRTESLIVIWIGANDYLYGHSDIETVTSDVVNTIRAAIESLIYYGGTNFLIINLPDMGKTPYAINSSIKELLSLTTIFHNAKLEAAVTAVAQGYKKVNIHLLDVHQLFEDLIAYPDVINKKHKMHITNTTAACWLGNYTLHHQTENELRIAQALGRHTKKHFLQHAIGFANTPLSTEHFESSLFIRYAGSTPALMEAQAVTELAQEGVEPCNKPDEHVFWDRIHPSANVHKMLSEKVIEFMEEHYKNKEIGTPG